MPRTGLERYNSILKRVKRENPNMSIKRQRELASSENNATKPLKSFKRSKYKSRYPNGPTYKVSGVKKKKRYKKAGKKLARPKRRVGDVEQKYEIVHQLKPVSGISYKGGSIRLAGVGDVNRQKAQLKASLGQQAGWLDVAISSAKTKREKNALRKKKREILAELNRIK